MSAVPKKGLKPVSRKKKMPVKHWLGILIGELDRVHYKDCDLVTPDVCTCDVRDSLNDPRWKRV